MRPRAWLPILTLLFLLSGCAVSQQAQTAPPPATYIDSAQCASCHAETYQKYRQTGMGRSFFKLRSSNQIEDYTRNNSFDHTASDRHYVMTQRDGVYFQKRFQKDPDGREINVIEQRVDYVIGSGNHARTYLHRTAQNKLIELPVGWYAEEGGHWGMNPGYDWQHHSDFRRKITLECLFCHNAYPLAIHDSDSADMEAVLQPAEIPEGIDCQRCHGPGSAHVREPRADNIVNPARLSPERSLEVCLQCHLETTSNPLPYAVRRFDRGVFSFRPGEVLSNYVIHFDNAPGTGHDDKFEIAGAAYRLRKSNCFLQSAGRMTCTTCHNPHDIPRSVEATAAYRAACLKCHQNVITAMVAENRHTASSDCITCHMPKRRTDDAVHVVMTDHWIQRRPPSRNLLAPLTERHSENEDSYKGTVVLHYPPDLQANSENEIYLAVAQVTARSNLAQGIDRLRRALATNKTASGHAYFELAKAYSEENSFDLAIPMYEKALERLPEYWPALHRLGLAFSRTGKLERAAEFIERAAARSTDGTVLSDLALVYRRMGRLEPAISALKHAAAQDDTLPHVYSNLGGMLMESGDVSGAEQAFRDAIRIQPDLVAADFNLGALLASLGRKREALLYLQIAANGSDLNLRRLALAEIARLQ